jgi:hypothetical protein
MPSADVDAVRPHKLFMEEIWVTNQIMNFVLTCGTKLQVDCPTILSEKHMNTWGKTDFASKKWTFPKSFKLEQGK